MSETVTRTAIPGLLVIDLAVHEDARGWFKENWQRARMVADGLPDFGPVQQNIAFNVDTGVTRGLHAEPWDKLVSVAKGKVFGVWVDLRAGGTFGQVYTHEIGVGQAFFIPRGVANGYQTLEDGTVYSYLANEHWSAEAKNSYAFVNLADKALGVKWPIPLNSAIISAADEQHGLLCDVVPIREKQAVVIGAKGQLGTALTRLIPDALGLDLPEFDFTDPKVVESYPWAQVGAIINAAAYTDVDDAESLEGRKAAWAANVAAVANLVKVAREHRITLVHISSDYVFDGTQKEHLEAEAFAPLNVYGETKAAGDTVVGTYGNHYLVRTSWMIGAGKNFVKTMAALAQNGVKPSVVDDQYGRLTFTQDLAAGILALLRGRAPFGTYNLSNTGPVRSWAEIAADVFELVGHRREEVTKVSTEEYLAGHLQALRPRYSALNLDKIRAFGFEPASQQDRLREYVASLG
ncbi:MAG: bifunctional dTDP-4-dehydrorhamnose 3,5-epimerase family protein/NAD(P)-dependent oxidoreductase [Propionibacteriaceae bacterium]|jgi:dTDP-4-dehydrorhamnose 3,5-epimerase|nr:bifunctional dTDP-4-dehydrorhamnose 3,5-epimerase family protein/NAD(P)-dependent oxidoreductase [Propionibacteriaceae bacterium]